MPVTPFTHSLLHPFLFSLHTYHSNKHCLFNQKKKKKKKSPRIMRLTPLGQMAFLLSHSCLVRGLGPSVCTPAAPGAATPALIKQVIVGLAPLLYARVDPIISPGKASAHVHLGMGGSNWAPSMDEDTALNSSCTSTQAKADKSVYWTPRLSFRSPQNGSYISVAATQEKVYYGYGHYFATPPLLTDSSALP